MKIAIANWSRRRAGGVETYLAEVMPALLRLGHEIGLISEIDEPVDREPIAHENLSLDVCAQQLGLAATVQSLAGWKPDVIYAHQMQDLVLERSLPEIAPVVAFGHAYFGTCISGTKTHRLPSVHPCGRQIGPGCLVRYFPNRCGGLNPITMMRLYQHQTSRLALMRRYFRIVTFSDHMAREYENHGIRATRLWSEDDRLIGDPVHGRVAAAPAEPWRFMFLGRFEFLKGIDVLLEAVSILAGEIRREMILTLVGDGSERSRVERKAVSITTAKENVQIEITGWLTGDALEREWERTHTLVMPSIWPEPFGLVGIEAGRRRLPVAAFAVGAIPEWLEDGVNGVLADLHGDSARNLADGLHRLMTDPELYATMSANALRLAERFSMDKHLGALCGVLEQAAGSAAREAS